MVDSSETTQKLSTLYSMIVGNKEVIDLQYLRKLSRDFYLIDEKFPEIKLENLFNKIIPADQAKQGLSFEQFQELLGSIANEKGIPIDKIYDQIFQNSLSSKFTVGKARPSLKSNLGIWPLDEKEMQIVESLQNSLEGEEQKKQ